MDTRPRRVGLLMSWSNTVMEPAISCSNLRVVEVLEGLRDALAVPVTSCKDATPHAVRDRLAAPL